jgi:DNA-3-methyladenine glycosylase I
MLTDSGQTSPRRCAWAEGDALMRDYHDSEWGVPEYDSRALWEKLILDGFQAGLSWSIILKKRAAFRKAFCGFEPASVARFTVHDVERLLANPDIVRSRSKIEAAIGNAKAYLAMMRDGEEFATFVWNFVDGTPVQTTGARPTKTALSETISRELKRRHFKFVGPTIVYAWMQAVGIVNDHASDCFRREVVANTAVQRP